MYWLNTIITILILFLSLTGCISALIFLTIIVRYRPCRTLPILVVGNSCCAEFVTTGSTIIQAISIIHYVCRHFIAYGATYLLPVQHVVVYLFSYIDHYSMDFVILISINSCLCQTPFKDVFGFMIIATSIYLIPLPLIIFIYGILLRSHIKNSRSAARQSIAEHQRMRRELSILKRIAIPVIILFILGFPYLVFFLHAQFVTSPVPHGLLISTLFVIGGQAAVMIFNLMTTDTVRRRLITIIHCQPSGQVQCITTVPIRQQ
jgi:hypothetical protein